MEARMTDSRLEGASTDAPISKAEYFQKYPAFFMRAE